MNIKEILKWATETELNSLATVIPALSKVYAERMKKEYECDDCTFELEIKIIGVRIVSVEIDYNDDQIKELGQLVKKHDRH